jgi:hypothetical protein
VVDLLGCEGSQISNVATSSLLSLALSVPPTMSTCCAIQAGVYDIDTGGARQGRVVCLHRCLWGLTKHCCQVPAVKGTVSVSIHDAPLTLESGSSTAVGYHLYK